MRPRRSFRRRHGKRRSKYHPKKSRFTKRVLRAELANSNTKKFKFIDIFNNGLQAGDGTSRTLVIFSPLTNIVQSDAITGFSGNIIYPKGIRLRAAVSNAVSPGFQQFYIRWIFFWSKARASYPVTTGQSFGNTTRANAGPAQTSPNANPSIFDSTLVASSPFVADSFATPLDTTKIKVISTKTWSVNRIGAGPGVNVYKTFFRFPKRRITYEDTVESPLTSAPNFPSYGNYYLTFEVYGPAGTGNIATTSLGAIDLTGYLYWKDLD